MSNGAGAALPLAGAGIGALSSFFTGGVPMPIDPSTSFALMPEAANMFGSFPAPSPTMTHNPLSNIYGQAQQGFGLGKQAQGIANDLAPDQVDPGVPPAPGKKPLQPSQPSSMAMSQLMSTLPPELRDSFAQTYGLA